MKRYKYRKVSPDILVQMKKLRKEGLSYQKISKILDITPSTIIYWLKPNERTKTINRALKSREKLTKEELRKREKRYLKRKREYYNKRYHEDPKFRERLISNIIKWQKSNKLEEEKNE